MTDYITSKWTPVPGRTYAFNTPKYSDWKMQLFPGTWWRPLSGGEPNRFHRWMMKRFFGFEWIYDPQGYL
jgi:hypothetical protein